MAKSMNPSPSTSPRVVAVSPKPWYSPPSGRLSSARVVGRSKTLRELFVGERAGEHTRFQALERLFRVPGECLASFSFPGSSPPTDARTDRPQQIAMTCLLHAFSPAGGWPAGRHAESHDLNCMGTLPADQRQELYGRNVQVFPSSNVEIPCRHHRLQDRLMLMTWSCGGCATGRSTDGSPPRLPVTQLCWIRSIPLLPARDEVLNLARSRRGPDIIICA